jgi:outer membrane protein insertion porin family
VILRRTRAAALAAALFGAVQMALPIRAEAQDRPPAQALEQGPVLISRIAITGNERVTDEVIGRQIGIQPGDSVVYTHIQRAMQRLWATQQFADVEAWVTYDPTQPAAPYGLRFIVREQPLVADIRFDGLQSIRASQVRDSANLRPGMPYNPASVAVAESTIRRMLAGRGILLRDVETRLEPIETRPGEYRLLFQVEEGHRVAITDIEFVGNDFFSDAQLRGILNTKREGFFWFRPGTFDEERLLEDTRRTLPDYYASNGFIDMVVVGDSLIVDEETGKARLVIEVDEGPQYRLGSFEIRNARRFASEDLRMLVEQERGGLLRTLGIRLGGGPRYLDGALVFDRIAFERGAQQAEQMYRNQGFLYARINQVIERTPATEPGESPSAVVAWDVTEGAPAYITRINIMGNTYTHEDVIRNQLLVLPGDVYSEERLIQSYQRISALGFFETPLPMPDIQPDDLGNVEITFEVQEKQTGSVNFGTSVGGGVGVSGFLGYDQPNLFGRAKSGHLRWEFGRYSNNFEGSYTDPQLLGSRVSGSISLFNSRDRFFTFREGQRRRTGAGLRAGLPLPTDPRFSRLVVGYSLSRTTYEAFDDQDEAAGLFSLPPGVQSTITLGLTRNTLDHPFFPTFGSRQEFEVQVNGGPFGGDGDFQKYSLLGSWYVPVGQVGGEQPGSRPIRFTLGLTAEAGALIGDASRFPFDRFFMGGVQFGRPLRGYDETTITPGGYFPRGASGVPLDARLGDAYLRLGAEYAMRLTDAISLSAFYDAGNVWREPTQINPMRLARGAGLGVTLVTPFGPLGLDWAYGFDKTTPGWQIHFKFGQGF